MKSQYLYNRIQPSFPADVGPNLAHFWVHCPTQVENRYHCVWFKIGHLGDWVLNAGLVRKPEPNCRFFGLPSDPYGEENPISNWLNAVE